MIYSKSKSEDVYLRSQMLDIMQVCLMMYAKNQDKKYYDYAVWFGNEAKVLKEQIEKADYSERDRKKQLVDKLIKSL